MLVADILHSCSNDRVAAAAVASIGGDFSRKLRLLADRCGSTPGAVAASLVRRFAREAGERDWRRITLVMSGSDLPLLCGLRAIVETALQQQGIGIRLGEADQDTAVTVLPWVARSRLDKAGCHAC